MVADDSPMVGYDFLAVIYHFPEVKYDFRMVVSHFLMIGNDFSMVEDGLLTIKSTSEMLALDGGRLCNNRDCTEVTSVLVGGNLKAC